MFTSILERFDARYSKNIGKGTHTDRIIDLIIKELRRRGVKIMFLDEIQNLLKADMDEKDDIFNGFKKLSNQSQTRLILVGTPSSIDLFRDAQWVDERYRVLVLPKWEFTEEYLDLLTSIYKAYEDFLPGWDLVIEGKINSKIAWYLYKLSEGRLGKLIQIIRYAAVRSLSQNRTYITKEDYEYYCIENGRIVESIIN
jgi:hypothetical protein